MINKPWSAVLILFLSVMTAEKIWAQDDSGSGQGNYGGTDVPDLTAPREDVPSSPPPSESTPVPEEASPGGRSDMGESFDEPPRAPSSSPPSPSNMVLENLGPMSDDEESGGKSGTIDRKEGEKTSTQGASESLPQIYEIQGKDTLWNICQKFLDNPWYWPKLWSLNEYISNPHVIHPGNKLSFFMGSETAPPKLDILDESGKEVQKSKEGPSLEQAELVDKGAKDEGETTSQDGEVILPPSTQVKLKSITFISEKELKTSGKVSHSGEAKMLLSRGDRVYMSFDKATKVSVGDLFHVVEKIKKVKDPEKWLGSLGWLVRKKAVVKVVCLYPDIVEGVLTDSDEQVIRGDRIIAYRSPVRTLKPHDTDCKVQGQIAEAENQQFLISNNDFVFLNRGRKHGLDDGLRLAVVRRGDGMYAGDDAGLPYVIFGKLMVVETNEHTATAYVYDLRDSLEVGDKVVTPMPFCGQGAGNVCK